MTQPVGVVAVVERIRIHRDLLPQSGKPAQERAEISRFAGGNGKLLPHDLTAFRLVRKNGFHRGLRALGLLLPAALLLIVVLLVPQRVLVCRKHARERGTVIRIQPRAAKVAIDRLSRQDRQLVPQFAVDILPPNRHLFRLQAAVIERIQHTLDRNIARKIPQVDIASACLSGMAQQTVEQRVQIGAVDVRAGALVLLRQPCTAEKQHARVGSERGCIIAVRRGQRRQRRIEERQVHVQFGAGGKQDFASDGSPAGGLRHRKHHLTGSSCIIDQTILPVLWTGFCP